MEHRDQSKYPFRLLVFFFFWVLCVGSCLLKLVVESWLGDWWVAVLLGFIVDLGIWVFVGFGN